MTFRSFNKLSQAIDFLATNLDASDFAAIADQCTQAASDVEPAFPGRDPPRAYRLRAIEALGRRHAKESLRSTYRSRRFPWFSKKLKLGGHAKELGHIHVDFVREGKSWHLEEISVCR